MIYDTHAHLDLIKKNYLPILIENAKKARVKSIVTQSVNIDSLKNSFEIHKKYPELVKFSAGLYPEETLEETDFDELKKFVLENKEDVFAIGEIGMDGTSGHANMVTQERVFRKQLELAQELNVPVSIHTRKAEKQIVEILKEYPKVKRILHCFSGKLKLAKEAEGIGCYFSIPANIVRSEHFQKMVEMLPKEKILTETDTPYLSPLKEKQNEPAFIQETIKLISLLWKEPVENVEKQIEENFNRIYLV